MDVLSELQIKIETIDEKLRELNTRIECSHKATNLGKIELNLAILTVILFITLSSIVFILNDVHEIRLSLTPFTLTLEEEKQ